MTQKIRQMSPQTVRVLERFAERPSDWHYGYELSRETSLKSGTLYPILMRLAKYRMLETKWISTENGVPPRHTYRLTAKGVEVLRDQLVGVRPRLPAGRLAPNEGGA
jgi:PadR family transcriptional regulator PadR